MGNKHERETGANMMRMPVTVYRDLWFRNRGLAQQVKALVLSKDFDSQYLRGAHNHPQFQLQGI